MKRPGSGALMANRWVAVCAVGASVVAGCQSPPPPPPAPALDPGQVSAAAQATNRLEEPAQIIFEWAARELGAGRFSGRGVARVQPAHNARLDLFLDSGETAATAALVGGELRMPAGAPENLIPPPRMLWGAIGVVRPGTGAGLLGAETLDDGRIRLRYGYVNGEELRYILSGGRLVEVELVQGTDRVRHVELSVATDSRYPTEAVYRDFLASTELRITREAVQVVEPFPADIWNVGG